MSVHNWTLEKRRTIIILRLFGMGTYAIQAQALSRRFACYFTPTELSSQYNTLKNDPSPTSLFSTVSALSPDCALVTQTLSSCKIEPSSKPRKGTKVFSRLHRSSFTNEMDRVIWILRTTAAQKYAHTERTFKEIASILNAIFDTEFGPHSITTRHKSLSRLPRRPANDAFWPTVLSLSYTDEVARKTIEEAAYHTVEGVSYTFSPQEDELLCVVRQRFRYGPAEEVKEKWTVEKRFSTTYFDGRVHGLREGLVGEEGLWEMVRGWSWKEVQNRLGFEDRDMRLKCEVW
ncbi:MAG: hypothetical protein M1836_006534 [Candelina mexicana]|nr:MAG: hypothetical protein M1836_006534 [Candelina mexicana]